MTYQDYPENVIRLMRSQMLKLGYAIAHHYGNRHTNGNTLVRHWIDTYRRADKASGYSLAMAKVKARDDSNQSQSITERRP